MIGDEELQKPKRDEETHAAPPAPDQSFGIRNARDELLAHGSYDACERLLRVIRTDPEDGTRIVRLAHRGRRRG